MARVLIDDFGAVLRLGFKEILTEQGMDVVADTDDGTDGIVDRLIESLPDVVVLDLDIEGNLERADAISCTFPAVTVILCSSHGDPYMRVFPPFHRGESYSSPLSPERFLEAVSRSG